MGGYEAAEMDDEYAKLIRRMNPPRVVIDNESCNNATVIRVDSVNRQGILLEVVQVLTDLDVVITKAYMSSDGEWFMDVFHVIDLEGNKIRDKETIDYIQKVIETNACVFPSLRVSVGAMHPKEYTTIELTGADRPGLLSEVCAVLTAQKCNVVRAEMWTHNNRAAVVIHVTDVPTSGAIEDQLRLSAIKELLCYVLKGNSAVSRAGKVRVAMGLTHTQRRLHQLMFDDRDYERAEINGVNCNSSSSSSRSSRRPHVALLDCVEKDYTVAILRSKDRPKLLFDTICTLTDMQYVVFHGTVDTGGNEAYQEYYIRHVDGSPISSEAERQRVIECLEAAIERRASDGLELELRTQDRVGLLSEITRIFRENGLSIIRAEISTKGSEVLDTFHVCDMSGGSAADTETIDSIRRQIGLKNLRVKHSPLPPSEPSAEAPTGFLFGSFLKACSLQNFRLIRSHS